jgi:lactate dehydrogenase-like 2-hydroxyacid dehydrogenase
MYGVHGVLFALTTPGYIPGALLVFSDPIAMRDWRGARVRKENEKRIAMKDALVTAIGLIGAGHIGSQIARLAVANDYNVVISNSRGPETLSALVAELGPRARAATAVDAAKA